MRFTSVVFPLPRKPVTIQTGILAKRVLLATPNPKQRGLRVSFYGLGFKAPEYNRNIPTRVLIFDSIPTILLGFPVWGSQQSVTIPNVKG